MSRKRRNKLVSHSNIQVGSISPAATKSRWQERTTICNLYLRARRCTSRASSLAAGRSMREVNSSKRSGVRDPKSSRERRSPSSRRRATCARACSPPLSDLNGLMAMWRSSCAAPQNSLARVSEAKCPRTGTSDAHSTSRGKPKSRLASVVLPLPEGPVTKPTVNLPILGSVGTWCTQRPSKGPSRRSEMLLNCSLREPSGWPT
mmetsp:Transcript_21161/g.56414  ORF Transcript_21161/g.56414 Transcript_21161/m.56414 type:complete len:204 (+) Transcript_21161:1305-1916(+)